VERLGFGAEFCPGRWLKTNCKYRDKLFAYTRELAAVILSGGNSHVLRKQGLPKRRGLYCDKLISRQNKYQKRKFDGGN
jgi:hypothetical protein